MTLPDHVHELVEYEVACAYANGYADGRAAADSDLVVALAHALSSGQTADYREAVSVHHRSVDAKARRAAADRGELAA